VALLIPVGSDPFGTDQRPGVAIATGVRPGPFVKLPPANQAGIRRKSPVGKSQQQHKKETGGRTESCRHRDLLLEKHYGNWNTFLQRDMASQSLRTIFCACLRWPYVCQNMSRPDHTRPDSRANMPARLCQRASLPVHFWQTQTTQTGKIVALAGLNTVRKPPGSPTAGYYRAGEPGGVTFQITSNLHRPSYGAGRT